MRGKVTLRPTCFSSLELISRNLPPLLSATNAALVFDYSLQYNMRTGTNSEWRDKTIIKLAFPPCSSAIGGRGFCRYFMTRFSRTAKTVCNPCGDRYADRRFITLGLAAAWQLTETIPVINSISCLAVDFFAVNRLGRNDIIWVTGGD